MQRKKLLLITVFFVAVLFFYSASIPVFAESTVLKEGMENSSVTKLQSNLKKLGFFSIAPTGFYGDITIAAVEKFQRKYGLDRDGIAGKGTQAKIQKLLSAKSTKSGAASSKASGAASAAVSTAASTYGNKYLLPWFSAVDKIFAIGKIAEVYDITSGLSFKIKRTYGTNHADSETVSAEDTAIMKKIFGGEWTWVRRPVMITVDGIKIAASMAGMPHAGSDKYPVNEYISSRSGGYGRGMNLDTVKGNSMSGHFDVHFLGSRTHGTNRIDREHQKIVERAAEWAKARNY